MALTDSAIRVLKPRDKSYKVADEKGLYLLVTPSGGRLWKLKFRTSVGAEKKLSLGAYPEIGLKDARDLRGALAKRKPKHLSAILEPKRVGELLRAIDGYGGQGLPITRIALQLSPHVFVRPGELRRAEWSELSLDEAVWRIPAAKMKGRVEHVVPLSTQAVDLFRKAQALTGGKKYVFPSAHDSPKPMSENTVNGALRRLGFTGDEMTAHGFRAMASTLLNESGQWSADAIERALAHKDKDTVRAAYHRGMHWNERVEMAQWWSNYLDTLRKGADILPFGERPAA